ncbi:dihydropteroate synthase [Candidatus Ishikawella capsulata]|nr:dihydropteroate synthase [Candidatus Ishikawaella capsulata]
MQLYIHNSKIDLSFPKIMGILNTTPDSFYDGGKYYKLPDAINYTGKMINDGASIIDVGGESTRPGAKEVSIQEELDRVIPVIEAITRRFDVLISVNTSKPEVIRESSKAGSHIINDIRSLCMEGSIEAAAEVGLPVCLMHMQGNPQTMQYNPQYKKNVCSEINNFFSQRIICCESAGIPKKNLLLDPGFGFGKSINHNYDILVNLIKFHHFGLPLVVGMSRKSMIRDILNTSQCLIGSITCAVIAALQGIHIIRTHDVKETVEAMNIVAALRRKPQI